MADGFQRKIDTIVSSIVSAKKETNKIKVSESDIFENITQSISGLNDTGKLLVLDDLNKEANEKPSELLTTTGTISVNRLNEIVNAKIEIAEREGINLRAGEPVSKNNKITLGEGTLALVAVNAMLNNFETLTPEQRAILRENYDSLDSEQRRKYDKGMLDKIENSNLDNKTKKDLQDFFEGDFHSCINKVLDILQKKYGTDNFKLSNVEQKEILQIIKDLDIPDELKKELKKYDFEKLLAVDKDEQKLADWYIQRDKALSSGNLEEVERLDKLIEEYESSTEHKTALEMKEISKATEEQKEDTKEQDLEQSQEKIKGELQDCSQNAFDKQSKEQTEDIDLQQTIVQEIEQIPIALSKKFTPEQIKEALGIYTQLLSNLSKEELNNMNDDILDILYDNVDNMQLSESTEEILGIILPLTYDNGANDARSLYGLLTDETKRKEFFEQFDKVINQEVSQDKDVQLTGELEQVFSQYFNDNAVDLIVDAEQELAAEEKSEIPADQSDVTVDTTLDSTKPETITTENIEQVLGEEDTPENTALEVQDNSFIGKVKRVMANMRALKDADKSKGFFSRLGTSIQTVFGNKTEDYQSVEYDTEQPTASSLTQAVDEATLQQQRTNDIFQKVEVNPLEAVKQTELNKAKKALENADQVVEQDDLTQ